MVSLQQQQNSTQTGAASTMNGSRTNRQRQNNATSGRAANFPFNNHHHRRRTHQQGQNSHNSANTNSQRLGNAYIGKQIAIISKSGVRYTGKLVHLEDKQFTLTLANVRSHGTEGREVDEFIPPVSTVYPHIQFDANELLEVISFGPQTDSNSVPIDPAILSISDSHAAHNAKANQNSSTNRDETIENSHQFFDNASSVQPKRSNSNSNNRRPLNAQKHQTNQHRSGKSRCQNNNEKNITNQVKIDGLTIRKAPKSNESQKVDIDDSKIDINLGKCLDLGISQPEDAAASSELFSGESAFFDNVSSTVPAIDLSKIDFNKENSETFGKNFFKFARNSNHSRYNNYKHRQGGQKGRNAGFKNGPTQSDAAVNGENDGSAQTIAAKVEEKSGVAEN